jgi:hypothetical protein
MAVKLSALRAGRPLLSVRLEILRELSCKENIYFFRSMFAIVFVPIHCQRVTLEMGAETRESLHVKFLFFVLLQPTLEFCNAFPKNSPIYILWKSVVPELVLWTDERTKWYCEGNRRIFVTLLSKRTKKSCNLHSVVIICWRSIRTTSIVLSSLFSSLTPRMGCLTC